MSANRQFRRRFCKPLLHCLLSSVAATLSVVIFCEIILTLLTSLVVTDYYSHSVLAFKPATNKELKTPTSSSNQTISSNTSAMNLFKNETSFLAAESKELKSIFNKTQNSVVQVVTNVRNPSQTIIINGVPQTGRSTLLGSGFVYDKEGHIITNGHVVRNPSQIGNTTGKTNTNSSSNLYANGTNEVTFVDGNTYRAKIIGIDPASDIAVLQIVDYDFYPNEKDIAIPLVLGNSSQVEVGDQIFAFGNPYGLSNSMTRGIVSQLHRLLPNADTGFSIPDTIQTDAAINPGNSGGPLVNTKGQAIGMNTAIFSSTGQFSGIGFAIPSNTIAREVPFLMKNGIYLHPWLGISGGKISPDMARAAGLPANAKGVMVASVAADSPAKKAGLRGSQYGNGSTQIGDIITAVDGHTVRQIDDVINYIESHKKLGDNIELTVYRQGIIHLTVTLQPRPHTVISTQIQTPESPRSKGLPSTLFPK